MPSAEDIRWFKQQFAEPIEAAVNGTPFDLDMIVAIACQETGYIWSALRNCELDNSEILALCVGDTLDADKGRKAFPKTKSQLVAVQDGERMFEIARQALVNLAKYIPSYKGASSNPKKFCHGFGLFQRDLQFFIEDPSYFLDKKYEEFQETLGKCLDELRRSLKTLGFQDRTSLTDYEFACVAIAYNTGGFKKNKGLKQGHFNGSRYYGEEIFDYVALSRSVATGQAVRGRHVVMARGGLHLRKGPGTEFGITTTLAPGTELTVTAYDGASKWARVDLEDDGFIDGHVFAAFLVSANSSAAPEDVEEPA